jgi:energy-converting hydrogenase Eha subunit F
MFYVLYTVLSLILAILTFIAGFFIGEKLSQKQQKPKFAPKEKMINDDERRKAERVKKELANMLSYTGDMQEEITVD